MAYLGSQKEVPTTRRREVDTEAAENEMPKALRGARNREEVILSSQVGGLGSDVHELFQRSPGRSPAKKKFAPLCRIRQKTNGSNDLADFEEQFYGRNCKIQCKIIQIRRLNCA